MYRFLVVVLLLGLFSPVIAIDEVYSELHVDAVQFPTYASITQTEIPPLVRQDIAYRFYGTVAEPYPVSAPLRTIGEQKMFRITSVNGGGAADISTSLQAIGEHVYVWVEEGIAADSTLLELLAQRFDTEVYEFVRRLWGSEPSPGIDGETRIHLVITRRLRSGLGGYFSATNGYPASIAPNSNQHDMMVLSSFMLNLEMLDTAISSMAHEFFHMVHHHHDLNESNWVNEGIATLTEHLLGLDDSAFLVDAFRDAPQTSVTMWGTGNDRRAEYGSAMLFMIYLYDRFGIEMVQDIVSNPTNGWQSIDQQLMERGEPALDIVFADWTFANLLQDSHTPYAYQSLSQITPVQKRLFIPATPITITGELPAYGTHYYPYFEVPDSTTLTLQMPETIPLLPVEATSGKRVWYSQRGDASNPRLTRAFDLRDVSEAELTFNIWHDLELEWDYGYISVSTDGGERWQVQSTSLTTTADSNGRAYGAGYTGRDSGWQQEHLNLTAFAGQEVFVRIELVTDDAINFNGIALDDFRLDAIGYASDLETDGGGWLSEGWILSDNRLPARMWVQIVEESDGAPVIHRFLASGTDSYEIDFNPATQRVTVALSPIAPMTLQTVEYNLQVE